MVVKRVIERNVMAREARWTARVLAFVSAASVPSGAAWACSCASEYRPCLSLSEAPVVFVGRVTSVEAKTAELEGSEGKKRVRTALRAHFAVVEALRGLDSTVVDVDTGGGNGDCGYDFKSGERYLVHAYPTLGTDPILRRSWSKPAPLSTDICTRTRPLDDALD